MAEIFLEEWAAKKGVPRRTAQRWAEKRVIPARRKKMSKEYLKVWDAYMIDENATAPKRRKSD